MPFIYLLKLRYQDRQFIMSILAKLPTVGASITLAQASACAATKNKFAFSYIRYADGK